MRVMVLGAGVVGVASAWYLARAGHSVVVVDRQAEPAAETSFANGGQISASHAEPWATPTTPWKALRWLGNPDAPLLVRRRLDPALFRWLLGFLGECRPARTRANTRAILALALHSRARLKALRSELAAAGRGFDYQHRERGILHFYTDPAELEAARRAATLMRSFGLERQPKSAEECLAIEPALAGISRELVGGDYTADDESGDAMLFTRGLAADCRQAGVEFRLSAVVERVEPASSAGRPVRVIIDGRGEQADACVVALGSYTPLVLAGLGLDLPIYPAKGYSATFHLDEGVSAPTVSLTDDQYKLVFSRLGQRLRVAGTAEFTGYDRTIDGRRCDLIVRRARQLFPDLAGVGEPELWTGLRPATPSNVPLIGPTRLPGVWLNSGHGTLGWTLACGSGEALAEMMSGRRPAAEFPFLGG